MIDLTEYEKVASSGTSDAMFLAKKLHDLIVEVKKEQAAQDEFSYGITIDYTDGNSYGIHDEREIINCGWKSLATVKKCIDRIKAHAKFYDTKDIFAKPTKNTKYPEGVVWNDFDCMAQLELIKDDGTPFRLSAPWCNYFGFIDNIEISVVSSAL